MKPLAGFLFSHSTLAFFRAQSGLPNPAAQAPTSDNAPLPSLVCRAGAASKSRVCAQSPSLASRHPSVFSLIFSFPLDLYLLLLYHRWRCPSCSSRRSTRAVPLRASFHLQLAGYSAARSLSRSTWGTGRIPSRFYFRLERTIFAPWGRSVATSYETLPRNSPSHVSSPARFLALCYRVSLQVFPPFRSFSTLQYRHSPRCAVRPPTDGFWPYFNNSVCRPIAHGRGRAVSPYEMFGAMLRCDSARSLLPSSGAVFPCSILRNSCSLS